MLKKLCNYQNILGEPKVGVHSIRVFDIAIIDVILTFVLAKIVQLLFNWLLNSKISYLVALVICFITGIVLHRLFCVRTTVDKLLFKNPRI